MFTIRPAPRSRIRGASTWHPNSTPRRFTASTVVPLVRRDLQDGPGDGQRGVVDQHADGTEALLRRRHRALERRTLAGTVELSRPPRSPLPGSSSRATPGRRVAVDVGDGDGVPGGVQRVGDRAPEPLPGTRDQRGHQAFPKNSRRPTRASMRMKRHSRSSPMRVLRMMSHTPVTALRSGASARM